MKQLRHFLFATIVTALVFSSLTQRVWAMDSIPESKPTDVIQEVQAAIDPSEDVPIQEVEEKREANIKHFLTDNFRYVAMVYPMSVHYAENGKWKAIDNTLLDTVDEEKSDVLENTAGGIKIRLAKNSQSTKLVSLKSGNFGLSWTFKDIAKKAVQVVQPSQAKDEDLTTVENLTSSVTYLDVFEGVDLEYVLRGDEVKENLILKSKTAQHSFTQVFRFNGLTPKTQEDGTVWLVDEKDTLAFRLERFLMVDAKGEESQAVQTRWTQVNETWELTIEPDQEWLDDPERAYPVVVDPTVSTPLSPSQIEDTHVTSTLPTSNFYNSYILKTGNNVHRTFIRFTLPSLTAADMVIASTLQMSIDNVGTSQNDYQVNAHKVTGSWTETGLTWNNQPTYNSKIEDYEIVGHDAAKNAYAWNITSIVKEWYSSGFNNGLMLKNQTTESGYKEYYSADTSSAYLNFRPVVTIFYVNNNGLESYWTYHSQNVGRAGTGYTNDYNGNLVFIRQDTVGTGNRMPVSVSHVYNLNDRATNIGYGNGWRLNYTQQAGTQVIGSTTYYYWIDEDGTKHYFAYDSTKQKYMDEAGTQLWMVKNADNSYTMTDAQNNISKFNTAGKLYEIHNSNGQKITLIYTGNLLTEIQHAEWNIGEYENRRTILAYTDNLLQSITEVDGKVTTFTYTGTQLTSVTEEFDTDPTHDKISTYTYDTTGEHPNKLLTATNFDGYKMTYTYSDEMPYRVTKFIESQGSIEGEELSLSYGYNTTFYTDTNGRKSIYTFNNSGNTVTIQDPDGYAQYYSYNESGSVKNSMAVESKLQKTTNNLLLNHSYETDLEWVAGYWGVSTATTGYSTTSKYIGNRSMLINKTNTTDHHFFTQTVTGLTKGKTYTFSTYVKTSNISNVNGKGAELMIRYVDGSGNWNTAESKRISGTQDWQRIEVSFTLPADTTSTTILVRACIAQESGSAYFDALQLEEGNIANRYNLVENGDFTADETRWTRGGTWITGDGITTITDTGHPTAFSDKGLKIQGEYNKNKNASQTIPVSGVAGDSVVFSAWAKSASIPLSGQRYASLDIRFNYTDGDFSYHIANFNADSSEWQYLSFKAKANKAFSSVTIYVLYYLNVNTITFDGISLFMEEFGQSFTYDSNGNMTSITDLDRKTRHFNYANNNLMTAKDAQDNITNYSYDSTYIHRLTGASTSENIKYSFLYSNEGNATSTIIGDGTNGTRKIETTTEYTSDGNYVAKKKDALGNEVSYTINVLNGLVGSVKDPLGRTVTNNYKYDDSLASVSTTVGGQAVSNSYTYENDRLKTITHNGFDYTFVYDTFGNVTHVNVGTTTLITNTYQASTGRLNSFVYGNGDTVEYVFDSFDRITGVKVDGILRTTYDYGANGVVGRVNDVLSGKSTRYIYDFANRLVRVEESNGNSVAFGYDANNNASTFIDTVNGTTYTTSYTYDKDNRPTLVTSPKANTTGYVYDVLGRLTSKKWKVGAMEYSTTYTYKNHTTDTSLTSTQVASIQNGLNPLISYAYDKNGNITSITEDSETIEYVYNELNEVVRENNQRDSKTFVYNYDLGGNLLSKIEYAYTTGEDLGIPVNSISYAYGDANWKDLLTSFDGKAITYDAIGNPLTYDGGTFAWEGRKLTSFNKTGLAVSYTYNENGIRTSKTVNIGNDVTTNYRLSGDRVTFEQTGSDTIYYVYDTQGQLISMILNNVEYAYLRNAQNDIVGLINSAGAQVVSYTYSTWGEVLSITGSLASTLGQQNPYRYRGYRYDSETGLYYLQSRYYNPQWGRFLNADDSTVLGIDQGNLIQYNLFAYCVNNPVNRTDSSGYISIQLIVTLAGAVIGGMWTLTQYLMATPKNQWSLSTAVGKFLTGFSIGGVIGYISTLPSQMRNGAFGALNAVTTYAVNCKKANKPIRADRIIAEGIAGYVGGMSGGLIASKFGLGNVATTISSIVSGAIFALFS